MWGHFRNRPRTLQAENSYLQAIPKMGWKSAGTPAPSSVAEMRPSDGLTNRINGVFPMSSVCTEVVDATGFDVAMGKLYRRPKMREKTKNRLLKYRRIDEETGCWNWTKGVRKSNTSRYGRISIGHIGVSCHRASYWLFNGEFDTSLFVCHHCDNTLCFNPDHLFLGTNSDNILDAVRKGCVSFGSRRMSAKITEDTVRSIRDLHKRGWNVRSLCGHFKLGHRLIENVVYRQTWKHVS